MRYPLPWFPLSDNPSRYSCRATRGCRPYRSSHEGCRLVTVEVVGLLAAFSVFVDVVLIGETACVCTAHILRQD